MYQIQSTDTFLRNARKFFKKHPDLESRFKKIVHILENDPNHPSLKMHTLSGKFKGLYAIRLTYVYRITLILFVKEKEVVLQDIGSHDGVYQK